MSGIIQKKSTPSGIASPAAGSVFMGIDDSGVFYTKNESGTVTTYPTTSGGGSFTGGTVSSLNIDFTDTLQFKSNPSLDSVIVDPIINGKLVGEFLGVEETGSNGGYTATSYNGIFEGILDINDGFLEFPLLANVQTYTVTDGAAGSIIKFQGLLDQTSGGGSVALTTQDITAFIGINGSTEFAIIKNHDLDNEQSQMQIRSIISYPDVDETAEQYVIQFNGLTNGNDAEMYIGKNVSSNIIDESIYFNIAGYTTGFEISNNLSDNSASLFKVKDNNDDNIFDVRNDGVFATDLSATTLSSTTLNVDFTDTLDFVTSDNFETIIIDPLNQAKFTGDYMGSVNEASISGYTATGYVGIGDGVLDIGDGFAQLPFQGNINALTLNDGVASYVKITGLQDTTQFGNGVLLQMNEQSTLSGVSGTTALYYRQQHDLDNEVSQMNLGSFVILPDESFTNFYIEFFSANEFGAQMFIGKNNDLDEYIELILNENNSGFSIENNLSDSSASLFKIFDNNGADNFEVRNDGVFLPNLPTSDPLVANQLWLSGTTLQVSAGA